MANSSSRAFALIFRNCIQLHGDKPIEKKRKKKDIDGRILQNSIKIPPDRWFTPVTWAARDFLKTQMIPLFCLSPFYRRRRQRQRLTSVNTADKVRIKTRVIVTSSPNWRDTINEVYSYCLVVVWDLTWALTANCSILWIAKWCRLWGKINLPALLLMMVNRNAEVVSV